MNVALCVLAFASSAAHLSAGASASETSALLDFKGPGRNSDRLLTWTGTVCSQPWEAITCSNGKVTEIHLFSLQLQGTLPDSWSRLTNLQNLDMSWNHFSGTLPDSWSGLGKLETLNLAANSISGTLPASWGSLNVSRLYLDKNRLNGTLPDSWRQLGYLTDLFMLVNSISGTLPKSWSQLSNLQNIDMGFNQISGTLPESWSGLGKLETLNLAANSISGTLPASWGSLTVSRLYLNQNRLNGTLPDSWRRLAYLTDLFMQVNSISGTLPESWSQLKNIQYLNLSFNHITGTLPASWSALVNMSNILLDHNNLTATGSSAVAPAPVPGRTLSPPSGVEGSPASGTVVGFTAGPGISFTPSPAPGNIVALPPSASGSNVASGPLAGASTGPGASITPSLAPSSNMAWQPSASGSNVVSGHSAGASTGTPVPMPPPPPPVPSPSSNSGAIIGAAVGAAAALALLLAGCTYIAMRRRQRRSQADMQSPRKLADSNKGPWDEGKLNHEGAPKEHSSSTVQNVANGVSSSKPGDGLYKNATQPGAYREAASLTGTEHVKSWRSPWEGQELGQPSAVDSARSRHSQSCSSDVSSLKRHMPEPEFECNSLDSPPDPWEESPEGEGSVLSLLNTVQPRSGRATMLGDSARSEKSPVQLDAPTEGTDARGGVKSFATEAWHQSTELVRTAGSGVPKQTTPQPERQCAELDNMWKLKDGSVTLCLDSERKPVKLGQGGYGSVYLGKLRRSHSVAIKMVEASTDRDKQRFIREICLLRECRDPNIVRFWGAQILQESMLLVMEYCHGGDLYHAMLQDYKEEYRWHERGMQIALDIIHGLDYLHSQGVAHLDLKSPNVLIDRDGTAKIADVGLSKLVGTREATATSAGSLLWAAPEQIEMKACGTKADIWAFGTILWEICTGEQLVTRHQQCSGMDTLPGEVLDMIGQCHQSQAAARPTAVALKDRLLSMTNLPS